MAVPRVGRGTRATDELQDDRGKTYFHYQLRWGGRRSKAEIIAEMEADWAVPSSMPRPSSAPPMFSLSLTRSSFHGYMQLRISYTYRCRRTHKDPTSKPGSGGVPAT